MHEEFYINVKDLAEMFVNSLDGTPVKIAVSPTNDCIKSAAILVYALIQKGIKFVLETTKMFEVDNIKSYESNYNVFVFLIIDQDGVKLYGKKIKDKTIIVIGLSNQGINYQLNGITLPVATYIFCKNLCDMHEISHIAVLSLAKSEIVGPNKEVFNDAVNNEKIIVEKGITAFSMQTQPIVKAIAGSLWPYIPGITGDEDQAINFLKETGVDTKNVDGSYRRLIDLNDNEANKIIAGILLKRLGGSDEELIFDDIFLLKNEGGITNDAKEFNLLIDCCVKFSKYSLAIGACLGGRLARTEALQLLYVYKYDLLQALQWFSKNKNGNRVFEQKEFVVIQSEENIKDIYLSDFLRIISKSNMYPDGKILIGMARASEDTLIGVSVGSHKEGIPLIKDAIKGAGYTITEDNNDGISMLVPQEKETEFIKTLQNALTKQFIEAKVLD